MPRKALAAIILLGLILRVVYAVAIYDPSFLNYNLDDFVSYRNAASDILHGDLAFTNSLYMKRPPLYALLVAALQIQPLVVIAANIALGTAIIPLTYVLARRFHISRQLALTAAVIIAIDAASIRQSANLRADALASVFLAFAFVSLLALRQTETRNSVLAWGLLASACIVSSAFSRPAAYLLWIPMALWLVLARRRWRLLAALALVSLSAVGVGLWKQHNAVYFQNDSFSTAGTYQLLYVRAASVLHQATGRDIDDVYAELARQVEAALGNEVGNITANWRHRHLASTSEMQGIMSEIAVGIFLEYPLYYLLTITIGLYRALLSVSVWPFWLSIVWNGFLLATSIYGLLDLLRKRRIADVFFLLLPCVYFLTGTLLVATASFDTRARVMITPLLAIMAVHGISRWLNRRKEASASP